MLIVALQECTSGDAFGEFLAYFDGWLMIHSLSDVCVMMM